MSFVCASDVSVLRAYYVIVLRVCYRLSAVTATPCCYECYELCRRCCESPTPQRRAPYTSTGCLLVQLKGMASVMICAGCRSALSNNLNLRCCICTDIYDLDCANVAEKRFLNTMTNDHKTSWKCQACRSKQPKVGNVDTPISVHSYGGQNETQLGHFELNDSHASEEMVSGAADDANNVNIRRGAGKILDWDTSYTDDPYFMDNIRVMIRKELEYVFEERLTKLFSKLVEDQAVASNSLRKELTELKDRVSTLERVILSLESNGHVDQPQPKPRPINAGIKHPYTKKPKETKSHTKSTVSPPLVRENDHVATDTEELPPQIVPKATVLTIDYSVRSTSNATNKGINDSHDEGWIGVKRKRPRNLLSEVIRGTASPGTTQLEASEQSRYLHLYFVKTGTAATQVLAHLERICGERSCTVDTLKARGNYASFKLCVPSKMSEIVMSPNNWAENICIKPWRQNFRAKHDQAKKP